jgi:hypothetical protein
MIKTVEKYRSIKCVSGVIAIVAVLSLSLVGCNSQKPVSNANPETLTGIQTGNAPWLSGTIGLKTRLKEIGLPALTKEGVVLHTHEHLDIFVAGRQVPVPADIGINDAAGFIAPIHTHDETGTIHVESPNLRTFNLGQFFDIWGVLFTDNCIGGYCSQGDEDLRVFVNGVMSQGDPRTIALEDHEEIVVTFGTSEELPNPVPSSYVFPQGL